MGGIIARLLGREDFEKILEHLDAQIGSVQQRLIQFESSRVSSLRRLLLSALFSFILYAIYWKWFLPMHMRPMYSVMYGSVFILIPTILWLFARVVNAYYQSRIRSYESWLDQLRKEQTYKLEELKRKLNWYNTEKLIHRYESRLAAPSTASSSQPSSSNAARSGPTTPVDRRSTHTSSSNMTSTAARQQALAAPATVHTTSQHHISRTATATTAATQQPPVAPATSDAGSVSSQTVEDHNHPSTPPVHSARGTDATTSTHMRIQSQQARMEAPRTVGGTVSALPRTMPVPAHMLRSESTQPRASTSTVNAPQSWIDRLVDLLVGESASNSFALICDKCKSNNGLAPQDEMETIEFVCSACQHLNSRLKTTAERRASSPTKSISTTIATTTAPISSQDVAASSSSSSSSAPAASTADSAADQEPESKKDR